MLVSFCVVSVSQKSETQLLTKLQNWRCGRDAANLKILLFCIVFGQKRQKLFFFFFVNMHQYDKDWISCQKVAYRSWEIEISIWPHLATWKFQHFLSFQFRFEWPPEWISNWGKNERESIQNNPVSQTNPRLGRNAPLPLI